MNFEGYERSDGRLGIRNTVIVAYLVECAHHVAKKIVDASADSSAHLIGFPGCYPNSYGFKMMQQLCSHPNVGAVLLVSLGCEGFNRDKLAVAIRESGRPVDLLVVQDSGGTQKTISPALRLFAVC